MKRTIQITAEDIASGTCGDPARCAVALAATRALGEPCTVPADMMLWFASCPEGIMLPESAWKFIIQYDSPHDRMRALCQPFSFEVEVPE